MVLNPEEEAKTLLLLSEEAKIHYGEEWMQSLNHASQSRSWWGETKSDCQVRIFKQCVKRWGLENHLGHCGKPILSGDEWSLLGPGMGTPASLSTIFKIILLLFFYSYRCKLLLCLPLLPSPSASFDFWPTPRYKVTASSLQYRNKVGISEMHVLLAQLVVFSGKN